MVKQYNNISKRKWLLIQKVREIVIFIAYFLINKNLGHEAEDKIADLFLDDRRFTVWPTKRLRFNRYGRI